MRAGKLDHEIVVQSFDFIVDETGNPVLTWTDFLTLRAQVVQQSTEEFMRNYGVTEETATVFRTRWADGITTSHRVVADGAIHNIKEVKPIGRRRGLEIRCVATGEDDG